MPIKLLSLVNLVPVIAGAETGAASTFDVTSVMTESVSTVQSQLFSVLAVVVPAIIVVVGAIVGVKFGISWLKKIRG